MNSLPGIHDEPCQFLEWDTRFFACNIARVAGAVLTEEGCHSIDQWCQDNAIACLYFLAASDNLASMRLAENSGFRLVDVRMTFSRGIDSTQCFSDPSIRQATPEDINDLQQIALQSHRDTRFHYDEHFDPARSDQLYSHWIKVSCERYADLVLTWQHHGRAAGYISCHLQKDKQTGSIGLIAVAETARGQGAGPMLLRSALSWFAEQNTQTVSVVTQGRNTAAQRLYQRQSFVTQSVQLFYHKWYGHQQADRNSGNP